MQYARLVSDPRAAIKAAIAGGARGIAVQTSGSTGAPREVLIGREALLASVAATAQRIGTASWLLALPADRIGGALVIARAAVAGTDLAEVAPGASAEEFAAAALALPAPRYTSLVPTQVVRLAATAQGRDALAAFHTVLVGGAPAPGVTANANLVSTYGATETCGGCVYDGVPLDGVAVRVARDGRVAISGPTLADGYADGDDAAFVTEGNAAEDNAARWFVTSDVGTWDGTLTVLGRADDAIITGGLKVHPARVERALAALPGIVDAAVAGVPDAEWGERVVAWVTTAQGIPTIEELRAALAADLAPHELPREVVVVGAVARSAGGKIDRAAMRALAAAHGRSRA